MSNEKAMRLRAIAAVNPRTGEEVGRYPQSTIADLNHAVKLAGETFISDALSERLRRAQMLRLMAINLREHSVDLIEICGSETGLTHERLGGELARTISQLDAFAALIEIGDYCDAIIDTADPALMPSRPDLRRMLMPLGPVAVFAASNFPLAFGVAGGDTASALAAGCPVILKGHPAHPGTGALVANLLHEAVAAASLPPGAFSFLQSNDDSLAEALVTSPQIAAVGFTGSLRAGRSLFNRAAARPVPIPVYAEMGSINPVVVTPAALSSRGDKIADGLALAVSSHAGQLCTKPGVIFVPEGPGAEAFCVSLLRRIGTIEVGPMLSTELRDAFRAGLLALDQPSIDRVELGADEAGNGAKQRPVVFRLKVNDLGEHPAALQEHFGPAVVVVSYRSTHELISALERLEGQLTATLHSEGADPARKRIVDALLSRCGRLIFNGFPTGVAVTWATQHGGPYPASTAPSTSSVGMTAISRFLRPVTYQSAPAALLPPELQDDNPLRIWRRLDGELTRAAVSPGRSQEAGSTGHPSRQWVSTRDTLDSNSSARSRGRRA